MHRLAHAVLLAAASAAPWAAPAATLRWAASRDIGSLAPVSSGETFTLSVLDRVYEALVRFDADLKIEPALAERWEVLGPTRWRFHDGAVLTAEDVVAGLKHATDEASPFKDNLPAFRDARAVDALTVDVDLNSAHPLPLNDLTDIFVFSKPRLVANHAEAPTDVGKGIEGYATRYADGTGPFRTMARIRSTSSHRSRRWRPDVVTRACRCRGPQG